ncbi:MAG: monovalent cation/H(+) antiporter subunit G [Atribacterota bacterium]
MRVLLGNILIVIALGFIVCGVYGLFRFRHFYPRVLIASKVDTVGFITLMTGIMVKSGFNFFTLKVLIIVGFFVLTNPLATHSIARSAYKSGYPLPEDDA